MIPMSKRKRDGKLRPRYPEDYPLWAESEKFFKRYKRKFGDSEITLNKIMILDENNVTNVLAWLKHYYTEFNESPHRIIGRYLHG